MNRPFRCLLALALTFALGGAQAAWFSNRYQQAAKALENGDYQAALDGFQDAYRRGVVLYRAGRYAEAAEQFEASERPEVELDARYNLGNARFQLGDYQGAVDAYEQVLASDPGHEDARHNLQVARARMQLEQRLPEEQPADEQGQEEEAAGGEKKQRQQEQSGARQEQQQEQQGSQQESEQQQQGGQQESEQQQQGGQQESEQQQQGGQQESEQQQQGGQQESGQEQEGGSESDRQSSGGQQSRDQQGGSDSGQQESGAGGGDGQQQEGASQGGDRQQQGGARGEERHQQQAEGGSEEGRQQDEGDERDRREQEGAGGEREQDRQQAGSDRQRQDEDGTGGEESREQEQATGGEQEQDMETDGGQESREEQRRGQGDRQDPGAEQEGGGREPDEKMEDRPGRRGAPSEEPLDSKSSQAVSEFDQMEEGGGAEPRADREPSSGDGPGGEGAMGLSGMMVEQWLDRVEGDPGRLLQSQFMLEERRQWERSGGQWVEPRPW